MITQTRNSEIPNSDFCALILDYMLQILEQRPKISALIKTAIHWPTIISYRTNRRAEEEVYFVVFRPAPVVDLFSRLIGVDLYAF